MITLMFKKSKVLFLTFLTISLIFIVQLSYLAVFKTPSIQEKQIKNSFVKVVSLPDLAISSESPFIRHRTLATAFDIYRDDNGLLEYYPSTFIYKADK